MSENPLIELQEWASDELRKSMDAEGERAETADQACKITDCCRALSVEHLIDVELEAAIDEQQDQDLQSEKEQDKQGMDDESIRDEACESES
ncbi:hypothetical protein chiPu_0005008 [Chiloscyllium punctatum]|uniref:Uncharacterized protein n=1 Tax=Chiloscyllium punctatum TaxID=137246 RepID=A0A401S878_CHIPU|nr:hypothetical protein [Chiloscyllium punctatum]